MASADDDRSLSAGHFLPQWMRGKINENRFDFDQGAFSPPSDDGSFFYIPYPRTKPEPPAESTQYTISSLVQHTNGTTGSSNNPTTVKPDYTKHTVPCQKFIPNVQTQDTSSSSSRAKSTSPPLKPKSNGTDDGFKGEAAACGSSVVRVAHQMVSGKSITRGFTVPPQQQQQQQHSGDEADERPIGFNPSIRRGSKSLPASPTSTPNGSPRSRRKLTNKYFTGAFVDVDKEKYQGSWILSGLLSKRENISKSVTTINEEQDSPTMLQAAASVASMAADEDMQKRKKPAQVFKAKPSELREMNCWSPTSM